MVLSFMVVWDLPSISKGVSSLQTSRLSAIYNEVAPSLAVFGMLFGKALQAQVESAESASSREACQRPYLDCPVMRLLSQIAASLTLQAEKARWWLMQTSLLCKEKALLSQVSPMHCKRHAHAGAHCNGEHSSDSSGHVGAGHPWCRPAFAVCVHLLLHPHCRLLYLHRPRRICGPHRIRLPEGKPKPL